MPYAPRMAKELEYNDHVKFQDIEGSLVAPPVIQDGIVTFFLNVGAPAYQKMEFLANQQIHVLLTPAVQVGNFDASASRLDIPDTIELGEN